MKRVNTTGEMSLASNKVPVIVNIIKNENIAQEEESRAGEDPPTQEQARFTPFEPLEKWELRWKENYFAITQNIHEPRGDKFVCRECGALFPSRLSILTHSKIHVKPFCVLCMGYTATKSQMEFHMFRDHRKYTYYKNVLAAETEEADATCMIAARELYAAHKVKRIPVSPKSRLKKAGAGAQVKQLSEHLTKIVTSRFGRCITVKLPDF